MQQGKSFPGPRLRRSDGSEFDWWAVSDASMRALQVSNQGLYQNENGGKCEKGSVADRTQAFNYSTDSTVWLLPCPPYQSYFPTLPLGGASLETAKMDLRSCNDHGHSTKTMSEPDSNRRDASYSLNFSPSACCDGVLLEWPFLCNDSGKSSQAASECMPIQIQYWLPVLRRRAKSWTWLGPGRSTFLFDPSIYPSGYTPEQSTVRLKRVMEQGLSLEPEGFPLLPKYTFGGIDVGVNSWSCFFF